MQQRRHYQVLVVGMVAGIAITPASSALVTHGSTGAAAATLAPVPVCSSSTAAMAEATAATVRARSSSHRFQTNV